MSTRSLVFPSYQGDYIIFHKGNFLLLKGVVLPHPPLGWWKERAHTANSINKGIVIYNSLKNNLFFCTSTSASTWLKWQKELGTENFNHFFQEKSVSWEMAFGNADLYPPKLPMSVVTFHYTNQNQKSKKHRQFKFQIKS